MRRGLFLSLILLFLFESYSIAQWNSNRCSNYKVEDSILLDSFTILEHSIILNPNLDFSFKTDNSTLYLKDESNIETVNICYTVLPFILSDNKMIRSEEMLDSTGVVFKNYSFEEKEELFSTPGLEKSGVISRGVSFGNNQDVFVNSNLNLQMQGNIAKDVKLTAAISDQNVPIQPEGNTQQLQEFDRIYMELEHSRWKVTAGDIWLKNNPQNYFMKYNKRVQGADISVNIVEDSNYYSNTHVAASLARGKFFSQVITPIETVQGPYRLEGANGEKFIIVIANSEKVFLDGKEIRRGFNYDYTIDYNTGEITFNNNVVITKFSRIRVDFEYTERNFSRSVITFGHEQKLKDVDVYFEYFSEKDNPRQPIISELSDEDYFLLDAIGDSVQDAFINSAYQSDTIREIMYKQEVVGLDTIYVYSTNKDSAIFIVDFTDVGNGNGDYQRDFTSTINGRIYFYVGKGMGNYLPIRKLPVPNKREMMVMGSRWNVNENSSFFTELTLSNKDINLVSDLDDSNNQGVGVRTGFNDQKRKIYNSNYLLNSSIEYQFTQESFNPLDRIRDVDFQRDWNEDNEKKSDDNITLTTVNFYKNSGEYIKLNTNFRNKIDDVNGFQNEFKLNQTLGRLKVIGSSFMMNNKQNKSDAQWRKVSFNPSFNLNVLKPGISFNSEKNRIVNKEDSVLSTQMNYEEYNYYIENNDTSELKFKINYQNRKDYQPNNGELEWFYGFENSKWKDKAKTLTTELNTKVGANNTIGLTGTYRELNTKLKTNLGTDSTAFENNFLSRLDWNSNLLERHIRSELTYTVNTARELKREYIYQEWENYATATHVWKDNNNDGIKDLDEFFPIINNETENTYIRILVPTNEYIVAFTNNLNYRLNVKAPTKWRQKGGVKQIISRLDNSTTLNTERKTTKDDFNSRLNPFNGFLDSLDLNSIDVITFKKSLRSTLFYNRASPKYGFDITRLNLGTKQLVTSGTDARLLDEWKFNSRVNISRFVSLNSELIYADRASKSTYLSTRNYTINEMGVEPKVSFQPNKNLRFTTNYGYTLKKGFSLLENSNAEINRMGIETKLNQLSKRTITTGFNYIVINYNGDEATPLGYELLEALKVGNNYTWNVNLQQRLSNGLNITIMYEGRQSEGNKPVHTGRMQVSALF